MIQQLIFIIIKFSRIFKKKKKYLKKLNNNNISIIIYKIKNLKQIYYFMIHYIFFYQKE